MKTNFNLNKAANILLLLCAISFTFLSCSKSFEVSNPQQLNRWQKLYGTFYNEHLNDICLTDSGHVLIGTTIVSPGIDERSFLVFANDQGKEIWRDTAYETKTLMNGYAVAMSGNNLLAVIGKKKEGGNPQIAILTFSKFGKCIDTTTVTVDLPGTLALKEIRFTHSDANGASLIVLDSLTDQDACITYKFGAGELTIGTILRLQGRAATNRIYIKEEDNTTAYMSISIFDSKNEQYIRTAKIHNNIFQWSSIFNTRGGHSEQTAGVLLKQDTLIVTSSFQTNGDSIGVVLWKLSKSGFELKKEMTYFKKVHIFHECIQPDNGPIIFIGDGRIKNKNSNIFFASVQGNAKVIDNVFYGNTGLSSGKFIRYLPAGKNFLLAGDVFSSTNTDFFSIKTDEHGTWTH